MTHRIEGFDYAKVIMSLFVVIWHMHGIEKSLIFSKENFQQHSFSLSDLLNFNILLIAVPCFIFMSNYLYATKIAHIKILLHRLKRIAVLLAFWTFAIIIWQDGQKGLEQLQPESLPSLINIILTAGHTIYYFFISLIITLTLTHSLLRLSNGWLIAGMLISLALLAYLPFLTKTYNIYSLSAFWNPLNFTPYSFAAVIIARHHHLLMPIRYKLTFIAIMLYCLTTIFEWHYLTGRIFFDGQGYGIPAYTRTSLFWGVIAIAVISLNPCIKAPKLILFMSRYSLALYCLHFFLMGSISRFTATLSSNHALTTWSAIIFVIILSYGIAWVLKKFFLKPELLM
jgi:hypothetical protein